MAQRWWQDLPPVAGSFVMATGIVSVGLHLTGFEVVSWLIFALAAAVWLLLAIDFGTRLLWHRSQWEAEADTPPALTGVAATTVFGTRLSLSGWQIVACALLVLAAAIWPGLLLAVLRHWNRRMAGGAFLVCVSTQGLAVLAGTLARADVGDWLGWVALALFCIGVLLYLAAFAHFDIRQVWIGAGDQWVATGALAISTLAAAELVGAHQWTGAAHRLLEVVVLIVLGLNLFGYTILMVAEVIRPRPEYDIRRWATVFPLGMTAVATLTTSTAIDLPALCALGDLLLLVAVGAWALTFAVLLADRTTFESDRSA
ncbi:tellurite resistance/C4-dicarboxylate transporter family protein [Nocardia pseudovaccinii]|uniref:tellurite resistance/C4-dicarboxylate transporter family protein n=1 Tax=Nocardia pseudovaccinii TaxID=189540 RepID=UPI001FDF3A53|nr:tellurite resistance/C4-dicarboxylate transporter family protein [Nocardia pseudovaccinii]